MRHVLRVTDGVTNVFHHDIDSENAARNSKVGAKLAFSIHSPLIGSYPCLA